MKEITYLGLYETHQEAIDIRNNFFSSVRGTTV